MGILGKAKNTAKSGKLKGEIMLLDREIKAKKQTFGIALSDSLWDVEAKQKALGGRESKILSSLSGPWADAREDLSKIREQKDDIQAKLDTAARLKKSAEENQDETPRASFTDKAKAAGTEGKRRTKLQLLDRELKSRKQEFGVSVYDTAVKIFGTTPGATTGGTSLTDAKDQGAQSVSDAISKTKKMSFVEKQLAKAAIHTVSATLSKLTVSDQDVLRCIQAVQSEVEAIRLTQDAKRAEIEKLKQPGSSTDRLLRIDSD